MGLSYRVARAAVLPHDVANYLDRRRLDLLLDDEPVVFVTQPHHFVLDGADLLEIPQLLLLALAGHLPATENEVSVVCRVLDVHHAAHRNAASCAPPIDDPVVGDDTHALNNEAIPPINSIIDHAMKSTLNSFAGIQPIGDRISYHPGYAD